MTIRQGAEKKHIMRMYNKKYCNINIGKLYIHMNISFIHFIITNYTIILDAKTYSLIARRTNCAW